MNNLDLKKTSYDEILKEYKKTNEFNDSIFLDSSLLELIGGKGKSKLGQKMKIRNRSPRNKSPRNKSPRNKSPGKQNRNKKYKSDDDDDDDSDSYLNSDLDYYNYNLNEDYDSNSNIKNKHNLDLKINRLNKLIKKLSKKLFEFRAQQLANHVNSQASRVTDKVIEQLNVTQSGGSSNETSEVQEKQLVSLPRLLPLTKTGAYPSYVSAEIPPVLSETSSSKIPSSNIILSETSSSKIPSSNIILSETSLSETPSETQSSETPSETPSETESSETPSETESSETLSEISSFKTPSKTPETQGVIADVVRGAEKLLKYLKL
jgi:hypothetical protein